MVHTHTHTRCKYWQFFNILSFYCMQSPLSGVYLCNIIIGLYTGSSKLKWKRLWQRWLLLGFVYSICLSNLMILWICLYQREVERFSWPLQILLHVDIKINMANCNYNYVNYIINMPIVLVALQHCTQNWLHYICKLATQHMFLYRIPVLYLQ